VPFSADLLAAASADNISVQCLNIPALANRKRQISAPELVSLSVDAKLVVRAGAGIFYGGFENSTTVPILISVSVQPGFRRSDQRAITFANGSLGTLETGLSLWLDYVRLCEPAGAGLIGQNFHLKTLIHKVTTHRAVSAFAEPDGAGCLRRQWRAPLGVI